MQEDGIYDNLETIHDVKDKTIAIEDQTVSSDETLALKQENQKLKQELEEAKNQIQQLKINISALFKTAQNEIQKRDRYLHQMRKQLREEQMKPYMEEEDSNI